MADNGFNCEGALRNADGDAGLLREFLGVFVHDAPREIAKLKQACACGDLQTAGQCAHSLKGAARNFAASEMDRLCGLTETAAREGRLEDCVSCSDRLQVAWMVLEKDIRDYLARE